eukprot:55017-Amphidinium_carterae.1
MGTQTFPLLTLSWAFPSSGSVPANGGLTLRADPEARSLSEHHLVIDWGNGCSLDLRRHQGHALKV